MKQNIYLIIVVVLSLPVISCTKSGNSLEQAQSSASLTVVNLINGSNGIVTNFSPAVGSKTMDDTLQYYATAAEINYGSFIEFSSYSGNQPIAIVSITDTTVDEWSGMVTLPVGSIHSLYFVGPETLHIDTLLITDNLPYYPAGDSVIGVRFINLATGTNPVSVDIQGNSGSPITTGLGYKAVTTFSALPATSNNPSSGQYVFEFRDAMTDSLLATYSYNNLYLFKNVSVILGAMEQNGTISFNTTMVNDF
jgi:hypothetical protein